MPSQKPKVPVVTYQKDGDGVKEFKGSVGAVKIKESGSHGASKTQGKAQPAQKGPMLRGKK